MFQYWQFANNYGHWIIIASNKGLQKIVFFPKNSAEKINRYITQLSKKNVRENSKNGLIKKTIKNLEEYFLGKRENFHLPLIFQGTEFQKKVWEKLIDIRYGKTKTYKEIAMEIGNPKSARAVGMACNNNPLPIIIPCHRVIGSDGKLVGYNYGLNIKQTLLDLENKNDKQS